MVAVFANPIQVQNFNEHLGRINQSGPPVG